MPTAPPLHPRRLLPLATGVAYVVWTLLAVTGVLGPLDRALLAPAADPDGGWFQAVASVGVVFAPVVQYAGLLVLAWWAVRRRLRELALAIVVAVALAWAGTTAAKLLLQLPRPPFSPDILGVSGWGYPSGHMAAVVTLAVMVTATMVTTRQSHRTTRGWRVGAVVIVLAMAVDRWALGAHWFSDIVGGVLWGLTAALLALLICRVDLYPEPASAEQRAPEPTPGAGVDEPEPPRAAVIYNPTKVTDVPTFMRHVEYELERRGWRRAIWLETTAEDPGYEMAAIAKRKQVDLVIGAGGDGTVRVIAAGLAGTGIPFGLVAAGTGNLLARNMGIPLDEVRALEVAFDGADRPIDLIRVQVDGQEQEYACAFAGIGIDAEIVTADEGLKKAIGSSAYVVTAAQHTDHVPINARISVDDGPRVQTRAHMVLVGNVGVLQGGLQLIPEASPDDGVLDLLVASPRTISDWITVIARLVLRRDREDRSLARGTGRKVDVTLDRPERFELDGDPQGTCTRLTAEVDPGALLLRVPR